MMQYFALETKLPVRRSRATLVQEAPGAGGFGAVAGELHPQPSGAFPSRVRRDTLCDEEAADDG
jgi:hypothetical protein